MTQEEFVKILCVRCKRSVSALAKELGKSPQAFSQMLKRGTLTLDQLNEISNVLECKFRAEFVLPDGTTVEYNK